MSQKSVEETTVAENDSFKPFETPTGVKFVSAGLAASVAEIVTMPIDTSKVRLQVIYIYVVFLLIVNGVKPIHIRILKRGFVAN
jgi:hypothetical protein